ncbi:MAG: transporter permease, partial [Clostridiales bacterium]|nr:transporter permease [Clostridiales bacterium]
MTLFSIAIRNVKKNFYNYFLYFASMIFSIMIYYTFTSIQYNDQVLQIAGASQKVAVALNASSIIIAIFSAIFIWYSNSFFTRKRKKEIGLYSLMGVKKKQIGKMLFYENAAIGVLALGVGILVGSLLSKLFAMLLIRLMGFDAIVRFAIIPKAILNTIMVFAILFLITSIHGYTIIFRFKLVELFRAEKTSEREPKGSLVFAILSIILIGGGYWWYIKGLNITTNFLVIIFGTLAAVVSGTYLLFSSLVVFIIKLSKRNRRKYFKGINMIGTSQLLYRIKSQSRTLATIAILSASTLTALSVITSMYYDTSMRMDKNYPFTYAYFSRNEELDKKVEAVINKYPKNKLSSSIEVETVRIKGSYPRIYKNAPKEGSIYLVSETKYNEIARTRGIEELKLNSSDETYIVDEWYIKNLQESYTGKATIINIGNEKKSLKVVDFTGEPLFNQLMLPQLSVVKDEVFNQAYGSGKMFRMKLYITDNGKYSKEQSEEIRTIIDNENLDEYPYGYGYTSYYENYSGNLSTTGLIIFIGAFLGLVFLTATGSIIFFKQLSEANDDMGRYNILRNIGVNRGEIKRSIGKQML